MSIDALAVKRIRRTWEPEEKPWNDSALEMPWEEIEPPLHSITVFSLKNIFFFSHATPVQAVALSQLASNGESAVVEAPTGSGKTLAFLIPLMERTLRYCEAQARLHGRPPLSRNILGVIISPSRTLAEQTFVVAKRLAARYPFGIHFALCDGLVEKPEVVMERLTNGTRGAGTFLITTPMDFGELLVLFKKVEEQHANLQDDREAELLRGQSEETIRRYRAKQAKKMMGASEQTKKEDDSQRVQFFSCDEHRFIFVADEADLIFSAPAMRSIVTDFIEQRCAGVRLRGKPQKKGKRTRRDDGASQGGALLMDFAFVGATVATSSLVKQYAQEVCQLSQSHLNLITSNTSDNFISQLQNRFVVCEAHNFLPVLVQLMNTHASRKHFVFFNNYRALQFVHRLFTQLCQESRPLLYIKNIYVMYEGMTEGGRLEQYNSFLTHTTKPTEVKRSKKSLSEAEKKNQIFSGGWKRDGKPSMGAGAILLCTDIAAFGLDVRDVDYVYHFEPPSTVQSYIHRIGRVGRMGMKGCSILLLPCVLDNDRLAASRERKTTSSRFNTATNTKNFTSDLQTTRATIADLTPEKQAYVDELGLSSSLEEYSLPPFAPITATIRNVVERDDKLVKLAKTAAIAMCEATTEDQSTWFSPKLALQALLLD